MEERKDIQVENHGSVVLLRPATPEAVDWIEQNIGEDNGYQPYWPTVLVEPRYLEHIICGMVNAGLEVA